MGSDFKFAFKLASTVVGATILATTLLGFIVPTILNAGFPGSYILGGVTGIVGLFATLIGAFKLLSFFYIKGN
jgi:hypothetical protein